MSGFQSVLTKKDKIFGFIYIVVHAIVLSYGIVIVSALILPRLGISADAAWLNFGGYLFSFFVLLIMLGGFMKRSFYSFCDNKLRSLLSIVWGFFISVFLSNIVSYLMLVLAEHLGFSDTITNPNQDAIVALTHVNPAPFKAAAIILGPIVEEILFRGVLFGTIREKSRFWAYTISTLIFSFYHLWDDFIYAFEPYLFLTLLAYIPSSIALAYTYERSKNVWAPIFLHMLINILALAGI